MNRREELDLFLVKAQDLIDSKYILADIKIVNLLKTIASSETLLALFKNCLEDFDIEKAKKTYLVSNQYLSGKGEFVLPPNSKELLSFVFYVLMDVDAKRISLSEFLDKYFYEDGSCYASYAKFINEMIKPFVSSVKLLMESVIEGKLQDPIEALINEENRKREMLIEEENRKKKELELSAKAYGESVKAVKDLLLKDKTKVKSKKINPEKLEEIVLVIDMLANAVESDDKDAVYYAYVAYKYVAKSNRLLFFGRIRKISKLIGDVINGL